MKKIKYSDVKTMIKRLGNNKPLPCMFNYRDALDGGDPYAPEAAEIMVQKDSIVIAWCDLCDNVEATAIVFTKKSEYYYEDGHFIFTKSDGLDGKDDNDIDFIRLFIAQPVLVGDVFVAKK